MVLVFYDASTKSYAATVYLRIVSSKSSRVNLVVYSKMRLALLDSKNQCKHGQKQMTLPRLELLAVVIGVRMINFVTSELKLLITKRMLFTDYECVLHWIKATKQLPEFKSERKRILYLVMFPQFSIQLILPLEV